MKQTSAYLFLAILVLAGCHGVQDHTRGVRSICEIHHSLMTKKKVQIQYGLFRLNAWGLALQAASTNGFPHAEEEVLGGCVLGTATQAVIYVCPQCQLARRQWESAHPKPRKYTEDFVAGEWIGFDMGWRTEVFRLILKPDRTGVLTEAAGATTNGTDIYHYDISKWCIATNDILECEFRQRDIHEPLSMTGTMTGQGAGSLTAILHNGEGGWRQNVLFWRAKDLDEKLQILRQ
jgi:hypothetical protein